ncbi:MAG: flavodoxin family protein [Candidatus Heimdallarchaeaceae archaeon]|jgi:flavodoxin
MKILVSYFSQTGNTKKIAEAIHEVASMDHTSDLKELKEVDGEKLDEYDLLFVGSACHDADLGFVTHSTYLPEDEDKEFLYKRWAGHAPKTFERETKKKEIEYLGYFSCMGVPSPPIETFIHKQIIEDEDEWLVYIAEVRKHPNEEDLENAKKFAKEILEKC